MSDTRDQLKIIAVERIQKDNLAASSFREMGKAAGIKSSSVHYHFKSRDALLLELVKDFRSGFFDALQRRTGDISSPRQRLQHLFVIYADYYQNHELTLALAYQASIQELTGESRQAIADFHHELQTWVLDSLQPARFLPIPKESLALVVSSALQGALMMDRGQESAVHLDAVQEWLASLSSL